MNKRIKIVADNKIPFLKGVLEPYSNIVYHTGADFSKELVRDADALIIRTRTKCDSTLLEGSKVKFIATATIGFDHIDATYCRANGIKWTNAPGCNSGSVMQYIASALVGLSKKHNFNFSDKTIGIIGFGNVGTKVVRMANFLGMKVLINDPPLERQNHPGNYVSLEEIIKKADIISFHVPLNRSGRDKTFYMADETFFTSLKDGCFIINSSRGEVVQNDALKNALKSKKLGGAVLDVWENEPNLDLELLELLDFATPHIAGYSADGKANGTSESVRKISDFFNIGLGDWFPSDIPKPKKDVLIIDDEGKTEQIILSELILSSYDIGNDDELLRQSPETFEEQRGDYPLRREFGAYKALFLSGTNQFAEKIKKLGFNLN